MIDHMIKESTAVKGLLVTTAAALVMGLILGTSYMKKKTQTNQPMAKDTCEELAQTAGYPSNYTSDGTCWMQIDNVTVPYDLALDLIKFKYEATLTDKIVRLGEVRQDIAFNRKKM